MRVLHNGLEMEKSIERSTDFIVDVTSFLTFYLIVFENQHFSFSFTNTKENENTIATIHFRVALIIIVVQYFFW